MYEHRRGKRRKRRRRGRERRGRGGKEGEGAKRVDKKGGGKEEEGGGNEMEKKENKEKKEEFEGQREGEKRKVCREQEVKEITSTTNRMSMSMKSREFV